MESVTFESSSTEAESTTSTIDLFTSSLYDPIHDDSASSSYAERQVALVRVFLYWWNLTLTPIGILGNLLCLLVVCQPHNRSISCSVYMAALAVADTLMLVGNAGQIVILFSLHGVPLYQIKILCQAMYYLMFGSAHCGSMIILALLVERVIVVTRPLKAAVLSPGKAVITIIASCSFCAIYNIPRIFIVSATEHEHAGQHCTSHTGSLAFTYNMASFFITGVMPLLAIFIINIMILYGVKSSKREITRHSKKYVSENISTVSASCDENIVSSDQSEMSDLSDKMSNNAQSTKGTQGDRRETQLTLMTIVMTTAFMVCTVPRYAHNLTFASMEVDSSPDKYLIYVWSAAITSNLYALNSAINFYLYVMTGSKFRTDFVKLFKGKRNS